MSAADAPFIRRRPKDEGPLGFWSLRSEGIAGVQALSGERWTDYNLHDPGVTILEQLCYALTGLVYRADFPVADQLAGADGQLDFAALALHPADVAFPCRPTTARDYRQLLLDGVERAIDASVEPAGADEGAPRGVWRAQLRLAHGAHDESGRMERDAIRLLRANRNLGEDFEAEAARVEPRWCELQAEIEIGGPRDAADVLAEVYLFCERWIEAAEPLAGLAALRAAGATLEEAFDRPPVRRGVAAGPGGRGQRLFIADLMAGLEAVEGVHGVRSLALSVQGHVHRDSVQRQGSGWALRLRVPEAGAAAGQIVLTRRGSTVQPDPLRVHTRYLDMLAAERSNQAVPAGSFIGPRPRGVHRAPGPHPALQDLFPAVYGINHFGLEPGARRHDQAMAWQLKGYLALFDQVLAHAGEQLAHVRELFTVHGEARQTYWWRMLGEASIPGITHELYTQDAQRIERLVYHGHDDYEERKGRLADYLLSLHGESHPQSTLRQFPGPYTPAELESVLFPSKVARLSDSVRVRRDRAAAFDDSRPSWGEPDNESGLQRRVGLLLAFRQTHTRSLVEAVQRKGLEPTASTSGEHRERPANWQRLALPAAASAGPVPRLGAFAQRQVSEAALRAGAAADRYGVVPRTGGGVQLFLGPDEHGAFWRLGHFEDEAAAAREAAQLRAGLLRMDEEAQGLFVVEHLLLRPIGDSAAHQQLRDQGVLDDAALDLRLSVVLPAWPVRCREPNFRELAAETVLLNTPAHLQARCLWLEWDALRDFERRLRHWLQARAAWCADPHARALRLSMNHAACELLRVLLRRRGEGGA